MGPKRIGRRRLVLTDRGWGNGWDRGAGLAVANEAEARATEQAHPSSDMKFFEHRRPRVEAAVRRIAGVRSGFPDRARRRPPRWSVRPPKQGPPGRPPGLKISLPVTIPQPQADRGQNLDANPENRARRTWPRIVTNPGAPPAPLLPPGGPNGRSSPRRTRRPPESAPCPRRRGRLIVTPGVRPTGSGRRAIQETDSRTPARPIGGRLPITIVRRPPRLAGQAIRARGGPRAIVAQTWPEANSGQPYPRSRQDGAHLRSRSQQKAKQLRPVSQNREASIFTFPGWGGAIGPPQRGFRD